MMSWKKYAASIEEYFALGNRYEVHFEYLEDTIILKDGTPVILLGGVAPAGTFPETALVVISNVTEEEVEKLAAFVASLRPSTSTHPS
jgi:hypothetical protein